jgi:hypothetical protein
MQVSLVACRGDTPSSRLLKKPERGSTPNLGCDLLGGGKVVLFM